MISWGGEGETFSGVVKAMTNYLRCHDRLLGGGGKISFGVAKGDILRGGQGDDRLLGDAGDDRLIGDEGSDILRGGEGETFSGWSRR